MKSLRYKNYYTGKNKNKRKLLKERNNNIPTSKDRFEKLKKISGELKKVVVKKYPELNKNDIHFLTQLLGMELEFLFVELRSYNCGYNIYSNIF